MKTLLEKLSVALDRQAENHPHYTYKEEAENAMSSDSSGEGNAGSEEQKVEQR